MDEFSRYERWYSRNEPPTAHRLVPGKAFLLSQATRDRVEFAGRQVEALAVRAGSSLAGNGRNAPTPELARFAHTTVATSL